MCQRVEFNFNYRIRSDFMFKVGDKVRKKDGEKFLDGRKEVEVMEVIGTTVVLNGFISTHESKIEKVEEKSLEDMAYELGTKSIDNINPDHYKTGGIETINYIKAKLTEEEYKGYLKGNIIKYISRAEQKNGVEDYKKAQWYTNRLVEVTE